MKTFLILVAIALFGFAGRAQENTPGISGTKKFDCPGLGISFSFPSEFVSLGDEQLQKFDEKGRKAIREEFNRDDLVGWQTGCLNLQDSMKRTILMAHISVKEAVRLNGSVKQFIQKTFDDTNEFLISRVASKLGIQVKKEDVVKQSDLTIAGYSVKKEAVTITRGDLLVLGARYYFFEKEGRLYLLGFTGSFKADNNEEVEKAIEGAKNL